MRMPSPSTSRCSRRIAIGAAGAALAGLVLAPAALAASPPAAADAARATAVSLNQRKAPQPYVFSYPYNDHLSLGGGNFTVGGRVYMVVKLNSVPRTPASGSSRASDNTTPGVRSTSRRTSRPPARLRRTAMPRATTPAPTRGPPGSRSRSVSASTDGPSSEMTPGVWIQGFMLRVRAQLSRRAAV